MGEPALGEADGAGGPRQLLDSLHAVGRAFTAVLQILT